MDFNQLLSNCEEFVRQGRADKIGAHLRAVDLARIPREARLKLARVCRRASLIPLGLKILSPVIHADIGSPTDAESAEYAVLLQRTGAVREALGRLKGLDRARTPEAALFEAFCHFNTWNYKAAIAPLEHYLNLPLESYPRLVGQVNLASAWLNTQAWENAERLLKEIQAKAREFKANRLVGNSFEMLAQIKIGKGELQAAKPLLTEAGRILLSENTLDSLFVRKWMAVVAALESGSPAPLTALRAEATKFGDSETVREADFYALKAGFEARRFRHLLFGTPFAEYRRRIFAQFPGQAVEREYFVGRARSEKSINLLSGECHGLQALPPGKKVHQLLSMLLSDFYRPLPLGDLFAQLYPNEYFDPFTSPGRVARVISRTRGWLNESKIEAEIAVRNGTFSLQVTGDAKFVVGLRDREETLDTHHFLLERAQQTFPGEQLFSSGAACNHLELSETSFKRFARRALEEGRLERIGSGRGTSYRLKMAR